MEPKWVPASSGFVPDGAAVGCTNYRGPICVARAKHQGCVIPGKLLGGLHCVVSWEGRAVKKEAYQVLCYARETWHIMSAGIPIPKYALPIGSTDAEGVLFIGRVHRKGGVTILGTVTSKDSKCHAYVTAEKREVPFTNYEILTVPPESMQALTNRQDPTDFAQNYMHQNVGQSNMPMRQNYVQANNMPMHQNVGQSNMPMHQNYVQANNMPMHQNYVQANMPMRQNYVQDNNMLMHQNFDLNNSQQNFGQRNMSRQKYNQAPNNMQASNNIQAPNNTQAPNFPLGTTFGNQNPAPNFGMNSQFANSANCPPNFNNRNVQPNSAQNGAVKKNNLKLNNEKKKNHVKRGDNNQQRKENAHVSKLPPKSLNLNKLLDNPDIPSVKRVPHNQEKQLEIDDGDKITQQEQQRKTYNAKKQKNKKPEECRHLAEVPFLSLDCVDKMSGCEECSVQQPGRNLQCLHCRMVLCHGSNKHMMSHALKTSHVLCVSQENQAVWCFKCDTFLGAKALNHSNSKRTSGIDNYKSSERKLAPKDVPSMAVEEESQNAKMKETPDVTNLTNNDATGGLTLLNWLADLWPLATQTKQQIEESSFKEEVPANIQYVPVFMGENPFIAMKQEPKEKPCWVRCKDGEVPDGALSVGANLQGEIYVARLEHNDELIPGKFIPNYNSCCASSNGKEILKRQFEVLCHVDAEWVEMKETLPSKAVQGGHDKDFKPLYIGRQILENGSLVLGKVEAVDGKYQLVYLLSRKEHRSASDFEVLVSEEKIPVKGSSKPPAPRSRTPRTLNDRPACEFEPQDSAPRSRTLRSLNDRPACEFEPATCESQSSRYQNVRTHSQEYQVPEFFRLKHNNSQRSGAAAYIKWVTQRDGNIATGAVVGGTNHKGNVYVVRAEHNGEIIPGKLIPSFKSAYIAFNGGEVRKREYQVLCDANTIWYNMNSGDNIPQTAIPAGKSGGQTLYIGRVCNGVRITIGKVGEVDKICVAVQDGHEVYFNTFEILISTLYDPTAFSEIDQRKLANLALSLRESRPPASITQKTDTPRYREKEHKFELTLLASTDKDFIYVSDKMQKSIKTHAGIFGGGNFTKYNIKKIEKVTNTKVWDNYWHSCKKIKGENNDEVNEKKLFHGSPKCRDIVKTGFDERHSSQTGMFGAGVYFAEHSSKSNQYTCNSGSMLLCRVALGKIAERTIAERFSHAPPGHHSVKGVPTAIGLKYPEYIIYRGEQVILGLLLEFLANVHSKGLPCIPHHLHN